MNIIKRELRANTKSLIIWSVSMVIVVVMMMSEFSAYYQNEEMLGILDSFSSVFKIMGISLTDITTASGFLSLASFYFYIIAGIYGGLLGSSIIAKEERDKTCEFFLVLPISRRHAITNKLIAGIILNALFTITSLVSILVSLIPYEKGEGFYKFITLLMIAMFIIQLIFLSIGMLLSAMLKRYKKSGTYTISILLGLYLVSIFSGLNENLENLKFITPFKFFDASMLLNDKSFDPIYIIISISIIIAGIIGTYVIYPNRDVRI